MYQQQPPNYSFASASPAQSLAGGFNTGYSISNAVLQEKERKQQQAAAAQQKAEADAALEKALSPDATPQDKIRAAMLMDPKKAEIIQKQFQAMSSDQRRQVSGRYGAVYSALAQDKPKVAKDLLNEMADSLKNSGKQQEANMFNSLAASIDIDPFFVESKTLEILGGSEEGLETLTEVNDRLKDISDAEGDGGISILELKAQKANGQITPKNLKALSGAIKLDAAAFKEQIESGLSSESISELTGVSIEDIEAAKSNKGGLSPQDENKVLNTLRNEYRKDVKLEEDVLAFYDRVKSTQDTPAGDVALIFSFMRMLDPSSTVREGEFATAENTGPLVDRKTVLLYNKVINGTRLLPKQRKDFRSQAKDYADDSIKKVNFARNKVKSEAERLGLNTDNLFFKEGRDQPSGQAENNSESLPVITTQEQYNRLPPGTLYTEEDGKTYKK